MKGVRVYTSAKFKISLQNSYLKEKKMSETFDDAEMINARRNITLRK